MIQRPMASRTLIKKASTARTLPSSQLVERVSHKEGDMIHVILEWMSTDGPEKMKEDLMYFIMMSRRKPQPERT